MNKIVAGKTEFLHEDDTWQVSKHPANEVAKLKSEINDLKRQLAQANETIKEQSKAVREATEKKRIARQKLIRRNAMLRKVSRVLAYSDEGWEGLVKEIDEVLK